MCVVTQSRRVSLLDTYRWLATLRRIDAGVRFVKLIASRSRLSHSGSASRLI
jgi:hypothetical protein